MKHFFHAALITVCSALLCGCDSVDSINIDDLIVVEAFLYAGEPATDFRLSEAISLSSDDTVAAPISDAGVVLEKSGLRYTLEASDSAGYYHYTGADLTVEAGDVFRLEVSYQDHFVRAETVVPEAPRGVALSDQVLEVSTVGGGPGSGNFGGPGRIEQNAITVTWDNPDSELHYVVVESLTEGEPQYILPEFVRERFTGFQLITSPIEVDFYDVNGRSLEVFGTHQVIVYRVNEEYADLYNNREQDSRDLNEPPTNIQGGLGVFSAFNSEGLTFDVRSADG